MKAKLFLFSLIVSFVLLGACKDDDDDDKNKSLSRTQWVYSEMGIESVIHFTSNKDVTQTLTIRGELPELVTATYTYEPPKIIFTHSNGEVFTGDIDGDKLSITMIGAMSLIHVKK